MLSALPCIAATFEVPVGFQEPWVTLLSSAGHAQSTSGSADIYVAPPNFAASSEWQRRAENGAAIILQGSSPVAAAFDFTPSGSTVPVVHVVDEHNPALPIIWSQSVELPRYEIPAAAHVFVKERWTGAPVVAGLRVGAGAVLWLATDPGPNGYERFPYFMQALADLGFGPSFRSSQLWAFFDYAYRSRADPDYLAQRWRAAGISALHAAAWHFYDSDVTRDEYLRQLIEACHRHGILVYAWLELPHVSEQFWNAHPAWREKTALLQDAELDWRKLMNLQNPECAAAVRAGLQSMMKRFDWDGVNLAELYFESLEGTANPARFTPMNDDVRAAFREQSGWDPLEIRSTRADPASIRQFLDFRAGLAAKMQQDWLNFAEQLRGFKPDLDIVLTHVDDRFDTGMKDAIGADASHALSLLDSQPFTFMIEDPATVWNLGPRRYPEIAQKYRSLTPHADRLAIDINIVDRYQDVYPTKQQTGGELFELVHVAASVFPRVALYFENSILKPDLALLSAASALVSRFSQNKSKGQVSLDSPTDVELLWPLKSALVDGKPWPLISKTAVRLPAGPHIVEFSADTPPIAISDLNATLLAAGMDHESAWLRYSSSSRAIMTLDRKPAAIELDGKPFETACLASTDCTILLPRGDHEVAIR